jgi:hypothetical protein
MSAQFPNGTLLSVSTAFAAAITVTAVTNAAPPVASAAEPPEAGAILVLNSGWTDVNERIVRSLDPDSDGTFKLEGIDTTNIARFPAGVGVGSVVPVTTWVQLSQVREMSKTGGDQQFFTWQYLEDRSGRQRQRPTFKNAKSINLTLDYDPALAWYEALSQADAVKTPVVMRAVLPNGAELYYYVYPSFDADPSSTLNENMTNTATFSMISDLTRFEAA